jgi:large subunit ribosomal protein L29
VPVLKASEVRAMTREEMVEKLRELRAELSRAKATVKAGGTIENTARIRELRKSIAKILTIAKERERAGGG